MIQKFLQTYKEAFGNAVPLPVTFGYSHIPVTEINKIPRCMIGTIRKVCEGDSLTLSADNVLCGGGSLYTAFAPMQERIFSPLSVLRIPVFSPVCNPLTYILSRKMVKKNP